MPIGDTLTDEVENEEVTSTHEKDNDHIQEDDDTAPLQDDENIEEEAEQDTSDDSEEESQETKPSKGIDKRISKVLSENERLKTELWQIQREVKMLSNSASQQDFVTHQNTTPQQLDPRLDPQSDQFDFVLFSKALVREAVIQETKAEQEKRERAEMAKSVESDYMTVMQSINKARASDPSFDKTMQSFEKVFTPDMIYGLSSLQNPAAYLKHVFKNEKDVRALLQLPKKHPSEQVKLISKFGLQFEYQSKGQKPSAPSTKPKPIPQVGKGNAFGQKNGYNEKTGEFDRNGLNNWLDN